MRGFILTVMYLCLFTACLQAEEYIVVEGGKAGDEAAFFSSNTDKDWTEDNGALKKRGMYKYIGARHCFVPENLKVETKIEIEKPNKTAASFTIGLNQFLFDARSEVFMTEGQELYMTPDDKFSSTKIESGKPFTFVLEIKNGVTSFFINGECVGTMKRAYDSPVCLGFRPHRAMLKVYDFKVTGQKANPARAEDFMGIRETRPITVKPIPVNKNAGVPVCALDDFKQGTKKATLTSLNDGSSTECEISLSGKGNDSVAGIKSDSLKAAYLKAKSGFALKPFRLLMVEDGTKIIDQAITLYDDKAKFEFPQGSVKPVSGMPTIHINGESNGMMMGTVVRCPASLYFRGDNVRQFAEAGMTLYPMYITPYTFMNRDGSMREESFIYDFENYVTRFVSEAPNGRLLLRWRLIMSPEWCDVYPEEAIKLENGQKTLKGGINHKLQPSYASDLWRKQAGKILQKTLEQLRNSPFADRIAAIQVCHGNAGEWNHWGYHDNQFVDFSKPMQKAFGDWLKDKYGNVETLRKAWGNVNADFSNPVPAGKLRMDASDSLMRILPDGQQVADYYEFFSLYTVEDIEYFAKIVKGASNNRLLAGAFYGYYFAHMGGRPYHFQDSGHYGLRKYLESPDLDFVAACYPYYHLLENAAQNGACSSALLHGKAWLSENDQRTHRSGAVHLPYGTTSNLSESIEIARRGFMLNLGKQTSYYFYDFIQGWYSDAAFMKEIKKLRSLDRLSAKAGRENHAQVAVFVNEKGIPYISNRIENRMSEPFRMFCLEMDAAGAPWEVFLLNDIGNVDLSKYKMLVFPDAFRLDKDDIEAINTKAKGGRRTLLWLYAPGIISAETGKYSPESSEKLTGIKINFRKNTLFKKLTPDMSGLKSPVVTTSARPGFMTYIDDSKAKTFAKLDIDDLPGAAVRKFDDWRSIVICFPAIDRYWLREMYRQVGVHIWTENTYPVFHTAGPFIGLYSRKQEKHNIKLPQKEEVVIDINTGKILGRNTSSITITSPQQPATALLYAGPETFAKDVEALQSR